MSQRHSRSRLAGVLLAAVLAVGGVSVGPTAAAESTAIPFGDGFESGNTSVWPRKGIDGKGAVDVVAAPGGHAGKAARFTMPDQGNSYRTEIATSRLPYGSYRYTFSNYLPQDWISFGAQTIVSQWHGGAGTAPAVLLAVKADRWLMLVNWTVGSGPLNEIRYDLGPVRLGHWNQWSFDITWSTETTPGSITARLDGAQVGSHEGPNSYSQTTNAPHRDTVPYHKIGLYRPNWKAEKGYVNGGTPPVVIYYDDISITPLSRASGNPTALATSPQPVPSSAVPAPTKPAPATSPEPVTSAPSARPSASGSAVGTPAAKTPAPATATGPAVTGLAVAEPAATGSAAPGPTSGPADDVQAATDTDTDTDNDVRPLAETGASNRTPLVLAAGSVLLIGGLLLLFHRRARAATRRAHRKAP
ncbi:polysaccharide lyase [Streptomyces sp. BE303]|uniref:polysaccharide lyase n=1 Tax=Streptomyces sp. BE303 TaxID=3002528 RepID=UPI002E7A0490|nr:heparin lyase I family protein [Streptomyces sp. BE303]MED7952589.1 heparin lyase I family protein [Streptomyces sp. BE303]